MREGIEDAAYAHTLPALITEAQNSGNTVRKAAAQKAAQFLQRQFDGIDGSPRTDDT